MIASFDMSGTLKEEVIVDKYIDDFYIHYR